MAWPEPILHVDMDAFFVEVERLDRPELVGVPVVVGGGVPRGVVASASYEARRHGIRSAMPTAHALRRCPEVRVVAPRHDRYREISAIVFRVFRSFTPMVEGLSVDEAFLDVSGLRLHAPSSVVVAEQVREAVRQATGLPCSVGVAPTKFVAKLASERAKPDGLLHVEAGAVQDFLDPLPVSALWGVGEATRAGLARLGVEKIGDLAGVSEPALRRGLGPSLAHHLLELAAGIDPRPVVPDSEAKSISVEETYDTDVVDESHLTATLRAQADRLAARLERAGSVASTVTLKLRYSDFSTITRSITPGRPVGAAIELYREAVGLLRRLDRGDRPVRLVGIGASGLLPATGPAQLTLDGDDRWKTVDGTVAEVRRRFGDGAVVPARLVIPAEQDPNPQTG